MSYTPLMTPPIKSGQPVTAGRVLGGFGDDLANRRLDLIGVRLRVDAVEVQIHRRLVGAVEVLQVSECDQPAVAKAIGLIRGQ